MPYSPSQILIDQVTAYLTEQLGRAPTAAEILNGLVAPWVLGNIHNVLQVPSSNISLVPGQNIQEYIDQMETNGGGIVTLTPGTYNIDYDIELPGNITLQGSNRDAVIIDFGGGSFSIKLYGTMGTPTTGIVIQSLTVQNSTAPGIDVSYSNDFLFRNFNVYDCSVGVRIANSDYPSIELPVLDSNGTGIEITDAIGYSLIGGLFSASTAGHGVSLLRANSATVFNCEMSGNAGDGLHLVDTTDVSFISMTVATNTGDGFSLENSTIHIGPVTIEDNGAYGIDIDNACSNVLIATNTFITNSSGEVNDLGTGTLIRSNIGVADN